MKGTMTATFMVEGYDPNDSQMQTLSGIQPQSFEVGLTSDGTVVWSEMGTTLMLTTRGWAQVAFYANRLQNAASQAMESLANTTSLHEALLGQIEEMAPEEVKQHLSQVLRDLERAGEERL